MLKNSDVLKVQTKKHFGQENLHYNISMKLMGESNAFNQMRFNSISSKKEYPAEGKVRNPESY